MKDGWMSAAMSDDTLVVELLVRLKQSTATATATATASPSPPPPPPPPPPLTWSVRMPRSRALRCDPRCSPTTPLSWSAGAASASPSATAESLPRSKGAAVNHECATTTSTSRRSKRKKTFAELKEEESLLLKEKVHLKQELTKLRETFKEQTTENQSLKRVKLELGLYSAIYANSDGSKRLALSQQCERPTSTLQSTRHRNDRPQKESFDKSTEKENQGGFMLPDLNSLPCDDDCSEALLSR